MGHFAVLMYHRILSDGHPIGDADERRWAVTLPEFVWQMDRLRAQGRVGVSMEQVHAALTSGSGVPDAWVGLTFDDGNSSDHGHAFPLLAERGFRATFFVCGRRVGVSGGLTREMVRGLRDGGMHVGSHGMTHRFLTTLGADEEQGELVESRALLESIVEESVDHFAPPGGRWSERTRHVLQALSYRAVSTSAFGFNSTSRSRFAYRRIPIVAATPRDRFDAIVRGERRKLLPAYARATGVFLLRKALGERVTPRPRSVGTGNPS